VETGEGARGEWFAGLKGGGEYTEYGGFGTVEVGDYYVGVVVLVYLEEGS
jgi:hypothetical protein